MRRRPLYPLVALLIAVLGLVAAGTPASAASAPGAEPAEVHPLVFPVIGGVSYTDTFGAARSGGRAHQGQDLLGRKMQEVVAATGGRVTYVSSGTLSGNIVQITADDGWVSSYLHLNNDTPGSDDGFADPSDTFGPGIVKGARVGVGELVGYLGDSGNAENTAPHLHFELKTPKGVTVNAYASLRAADHTDHPVAVNQVAPVVDAKRSPISRLAGADRVATAVAVSKAGWPTGATDVVIAAGDRYAEALPASVLAAAKNGPLLLTTGASLPGVVAAELTRLKAVRVTVVGTVPTSVSDAAAGRGRTVTRLGVADDATATAVAVAEAVGGSGGVAVLVNDSRFADGVSATAIAAGRGWPVLLASGASVPQRTVDAWRALGVRRIVIVGGTAVVTERVEAFARSAGGCSGSGGCEVERLAGVDRYATSVAVVERGLQLGGRSARTVLLGTGTSYADVLASGPLASHVGGLALLVDGSGAGGDLASRSFLAEKAGDVQKVSILGGSSAVTDAADRAVQAALGLD